METDAGLKPTRDVRERISRDHGNDARRLVEYYMEYQRRFSSRLRRVSDQAEDGQPAKPVNDPADSR